MNVDYEHYRIFYYVAKFHSFTKAAAALYASQPNVTRTIKNLENALGCPLFFRSHRSVHLTPEGEKLFAHVKIAVEHLQSVEDELSSDNGLKSGTVSIGATENTLHYVLLPVLRRFRAAYPDIKLKVTNCNTTQAVNALAGGLVDFSVVTSPVRLPDTLQAVEIHQFREVAVCSEQFAAQADLKSPLTARDLQRYPLVCLGSQTMTYEFYTHYFYENGAGLTPDIEVATTDQILSIVKSGLGIGFVPEYFIREGGVRILDIQPPVPQRTICLISPADRLLSVAAKKFEQMILCEGKNV